MGVHLDLALKDQTNPLSGGKAHVEFPVSILEEMLELPTSNLKLPTSQIKTLLTPLLKQIYDKIMAENLVDIKTIKELFASLKQIYEKLIVGKLFDIKTIKTDITFNGENVLKGIFDITFDYTIVHKDGSEETGTIIGQGKIESGKIFNSVQIIPNTWKNTANQVVYHLN